MEIRIQGGGDENDPLSRMADQLRRAWQGNEQTLVTIPPGYEVVPPPSETKEGD